MRNLLPMPMPCMVLELLGGPDFIQDRSRDTVE